MYLVEDEDTLNTLKKLFETNLEKLIKDEQLKAKIQVMKFEVTKQFGIDLTSSKIR